MAPNEIERLIREHFTLGEIEVLAVNQDTVSWFIEVAGLMRMHTTSSGHLIYQGADWTQIEARRRLSRRRASQELIEGLDTMATAYCQALNKRPT